jgi:hypothetical protein
LGIPHHRKRYFLFESISLGDAAHFGWKPRVPENSLMMEIRFKLEKETKGALRYQEKKGARKGASASREA